MLSKKPAASPKGVSSPRGGGVSGDGSPSKTTRLKHLVFLKGNNADPILRALAARAPFWAESTADLPGATDSAADTWSSNLVWKPTWAKLKPPPVDYSRGNRDVRKRQVVNHLMAVEPLCAKHTLCNTMMAYYKGIGEDPFDCIPFTILVTLKGSDPARWPGWSTFLEAFKRYSSHPSCKNLWLVKPTGLNRGIGIEVHKDIAAIQTFLQGKAAKLLSSIAAQPAGANTYVLQKYIENPLLVHGRKFDLRIWVLLTDEGDVFLYLPGYVRTSSEVFSLDSEYKYIHLTNYCQQKYAPSFEKFEAGNTLSFDDFEKYLSDERSSRPGWDGKPILETVIMPQIKRIVGDTFRSLQGRGGNAAGFTENGFGRLPAKTGNHRFELLGYDFMIDTDYKVWFIEINTNPSISYQNEWHEKMVDVMIDQLFDLVVDPVFPGSVSSNSDRPPTILSGHYIPTQPRANVPRDGVTALDSYEEFAAGQPNVSPVAVDAPASSETDPADTPDPVPAIWASLKPGWQLLMNVYKHRAKGELPWVAQPSQSIHSKAGRAILSPSPVPMLDVLGGGNTSLRQSRTLERSARPSTADASSPLREALEAFPLNPGSTLQTLVETMTPSRRPSTSVAAASAAAIYNGSLSARRRPSSKGPPVKATPLSVTYGAPIATVSKPRQGIVTISEVNIRSRSQPRARAPKTVSSMLSTSYGFPPTVSPGSTSGTRKAVAPPASPIRALPTVDNSLGLSISQSQLLTRAASNSSVKAALAPATVEMLLSSSGSRGQVPVPPPPQVPGRVTVDSPSRARRASGSVATTITSPVRASAKPTFKR